MTDANPPGPDLNLLAALDAALDAARKTAPDEAVKQALRKWLRFETEPSKEEFDRVFDIGYPMAEIAYLFTPGLSGSRPIDRLARAAKGESQARAAAALAGSKFRIFEVVRVVRRDLAEARDCVSGATFRLVADGLDPALDRFEVAARLCPLGNDLFWPMPPMVPLGAQGGGAAARYPSRPGKGLINEPTVAAQIYREYLRAGAPLGFEFGFLSQGSVSLSLIDERLMQYVEAMREKPGGPTPTEQDLTALRTLATAERLAVAMSCAVELAAGGAGDVAAIYRDAARVLLDVLAGRSRVGSRVSGGLSDLREAVAAVFAPDPISPAVVALFDALLAESGVGKSGEPDETLARVIERIRALRRKTVEMGCTEAEALGAANKVAELLERYGLSLSEVELRKQTCEGFGFGAGRRQAGPLDDAFQSVAHFCECRMWTEKEADGTLRHVFFGLPADIEAARCLKDLVAQAFETETQAFKSAALYAQSGGADRRALLKSFQIGLGGGIRTKLSKLKSDRDKAASGSTGRDLAVVKRAIVDEELDKLGLVFRDKTRRRSPVIESAYREGAAAAHRFDVNEKL